MRRILIATDGSAAAKHAVELGVDLARDEGAAAAFVLVVPRSDLVAANGFGLVGYVPDETTPSDQAVLDEAMVMAKREGVPATSGLLRGDPVTEIVAYADQIDAELIVVGSRGHGAVTSALIGSVSRGVLTRSTRPVLIVRAVHATEVPDVLDSTTTLGRS